MNDITPKHFDREDLPFLGWIVLTEIGSENLYFEYKDNENHVRRGFIKIV